MADGEKKPEPPDLTILALAWAAYKRNDFTNPQWELYHQTRKPFSNALTSFVYGGIPSAPKQIVIASGIGELFSYRLSKAAGVRVAPVRLSEVEPASFEGFVKEVPGGWAISERVPQSIPIYYLHDACETIPCDLFPSLTEKVLHDYWRKFLDKRCPVERIAYKDFPDPAPEVALTAVKWDSPARLLSHAFRAFLHASHAHTSNALVDTKGELWLIDHERIVHRPDTRDIETIHALVERSPFVMGICRQISNITANDISAALYGIPHPFWAQGTTWREESKGVPHREPGAEFTSPGSSLAFNYFANRLEAWQKYFPPMKGTEQEKCEQK